MNKLKLTTLFFLAANLHMAQAQDGSDANAISRVAVSNPKDPELRSYAQMLKGMKAYNEKQQFAPDSELYFILIPKLKSINVQDVTMRLASDDASINIAIDSAGKFTLPFIEQNKDDEYDLILNIPKGRFLIRPYVKSVKLPDDVKRLGDLRLECEVRWAIEKQDVSLVFRTYVNLLSSGNPCTSRYVRVGFYAQPGVDSITLDTPKEKFSFKVSAAQTYSFPLWDTELSDDGLIRYGRTATVARKQED